MSEREEYKSRCNGSDGSHSYGTACKEEFVWRDKETCLSSDYVGDTHLMVIDNRSEVVSREQVGFEENGIGWQRSMSIPQISKDDVVCRNAWREPVILGKQLKIGPRLGR